MVCFFSIVFFLQRYEWSYTNRLTAQQRRTVWYSIRITTNDTSTFLVTLNGSFIHSTYTNMCCCDPYCSYTAIPYIPMLDGLRMCGKSIQCDCVLARARTGFSSTRPYVWLVSIYCLFIAAIVRYSDTVRCFWRTQWHLIELRHLADHSQNKLLYKQREKATIFFEEEQK